MIHIYSHTNTSRLQYTLEVLFKHILNVSFEVVDKAEFETITDVPKINYSSTQLPNSLWIKPHKLLFESSIQTQDTAVTHKEAIPYFFKTSNEADFSFDILASSFYMLSRYEEYLPFEADIHGRFTATQSLAYKANFLHLPVVNIWANQLRDLITKQFSNFKFPKKEYSQHNTIDIDYAYDFKGKPVLRRLGGLLKSCITFDVNSIKNRISYCFGGKDPFDVYDLLYQLQKENTIKTTYFFQVGDYGKFDKNLPLKKPLKNLIKHVSNFATIGLHPSYGSNADFNKLEKEHQNLSKVIGKPVTKSRQHFLKLAFPTTFENLIKLGVQEDYSMGFANELGFRAGISNAFPFFNLKTNTQRPLSLNPFQIMDVTLKDYLKLSPKEAVNQINTIKKTIQKEGGVFISLFHNSSLTDKGEWAGWLAIYKEAIR